MRPFHIALGAAIAVAAAAPICTSAEAASIRRQWHLSFTVPHLEMVSMRVLYRSNPKLRSMATGWPKGTVMCRIGSWIEMGQSVQMCQLIYIGAKATVENALSNDSDLFCDAAVVKAGNTIRVEGVEITDVQAKTLCNDIDKKELLIELRD